MAPFWVTAFLDFAPHHFDRGVAFWGASTGYDVSPRRGDDGEFATLLPPEGDSHLRVQRLAAGDDRVHLDLHVADPQAAAERAAAVGASIVADHGPEDYVVLRSPGGLPFCFVTHPAAHRAPPTAWPDGHRSALDQVCIDVPQASYDAECAFWAALTGWEPRASAVARDFSSLVRPAGQPVRLLLQRLGEPDGPARAHLDWATLDRAAETARHEATGATVEGRHAWWTVLADPVGRRYCITDRDPDTGMLPPARSQ
jgi:hypothetical protein